MRTTPILPLQQQATKPHRRQTDAPPGPGSSLGHTMTPRTEKFTTSATMTVAAHQPTRRPQSVTETAQTARSKLNHKNNATATICSTLYSTTVTEKFNTAVAAPGAAPKSTATPISPSKSTHTTFIPMTATIHRFCDNHEE